MSVNRVFLLGRVGKDPDIKHFETNSVANFSLATSERYKDRQGNQQERTDWHNIVVNGKMAKVVEDYVRKGTQLMIEGRIRYRKYEQNGQDRYITEIYCDRFELLGRPQNAGAPAAPSQGYHQPQSAPQHTPDPYDPGMDSFSNASDDLPF